MTDKTETDQTLAGKGILVTRPVHQSQAFCKMIEKAGGQAFAFPVIEIVEIDDSDTLYGIINTLDDFDIALFVSPNAVTCALNRVHKLHGTLPKHLRLGAVGRKSAQAIERFGYEVHICPPSRFDSEALLELPEMMQVAGKKVVIFRGEGGRELMAETLANRGAKVVFAEIYKRVRPAANINALRQVWSRGGIDLVTITSAEGLHNLFDMLDDLTRTWLCSTEILVGHERICSKALQLGIKKTPRVAADPSDESMFQAVLQWARQK